MRDRKLATAVRRLDQLNAREHELLVEANTELRGLLNQTNGELAAVRDALAKHLKETT